MKFVERRRMSAAQDLGQFNLPDRASLISYRPQRVLSNAVEKVGPW